MKKKALEEQMRKELEEKKKREKEEKAKKEEELFQKKLEIYEQMTEEQKEILLQTARDRFKLVKSEELLFMMAIQSIEVKEES
jgi:ribosomal protein L9